MGRGGPMLVDAPLSFRPWPKTVVALCLTVFVAAVGLGLLWAERDDPGDGATVGVLLVVGAILLARMANCRVWTEGCSLRVRNNLRSYRVAAAEIAEIRIGWPHRSKLLGTEGPLVVTDAGRRILLEGALRAVPRWRWSGTAGEQRSIAALEEWRRRCR